jgi:para-nitrobenzyl esterase
MHGGAWQTGSSQINWYTGTALARDGDCIVVTINYRLGIWGFMYSPDKPLACGNEDHILALEWIKANISSFGGDPDNVTISGQSAGGYNTQLLLDLRPDLYRRAIIQSSPASMAFNPHDASDVADTIRSSLPEGTTPQAASVAELLAAQITVATAHKSKVAQFAPIIFDGIAPGGRKPVTSADGRKDILVTWTQHDGSAFACLRQGPQTTVEDELSIQLTDAIFKNPSIELAERLHKAGHNVTTLENQWAPEGYFLGATHCVDLPLLLGDFEAWKEAPVHGEAGQEEWDRRGTALRRAWGRFARGEGLPDEVEGTEIRKYA